MWWLICVSDNDRYPLFQNWKVYPNILSLTAYGVIAKPFFLLKGLVLVKTVMRISDSFQYKGHYYNNKQLGKAAANDRGCTNMHAERENILAVLLNQPTLSTIRKKKLKKKHNNFILEIKNTIMYCIGFKGFELTLLWQCHL